MVKLENAAISDRAIIQKELQRVSPYITCRNDFNKINAQYMQGLGKLQFHLLVDYGAMAHVIHGQNVLFNIAQGESGELEVKLIARAI